MTVSPTANRQPPGRCCCHSAVPPCIHFGRRVPTGKEGEYMDRVLTARARGRHGATGRLQSSALARRGLSRPPGPPGPRRRRRVAVLPRRLPRALVFLLAPALSCSCTFCCCCCCCCCCSPSAAQRFSHPPRRPSTVAVGETVFLLHPPLPMLGVSTGLKRTYHQNDSLADG